MRAVASMGWQLLGFFRHLLCCMRLFRRMFALLMALGALAVTTTAADFKLLPMISGELSGRFKSQTLSSAPEVAWTLKVTPEGATRRKIEAQLLAEGSRLHLRAVMDTATGDGTWEIVESELDAAAWLVVLSPHLGELAAGVAAGGNIQLSGKGVIQGGRPAGFAKLVWSQGSLRNEAAGWILDGITLQGDLAIDVSDLAAMTSSAPWELSIGTISSNRFGARNLFVQAQFNQNRTVSLLEARVEVAGGGVTVDRSTVSLFPPVLDFNVRIDRVGLQDLVALVPGSVSEAKGRIDGVVRLGWSREAGLQIGAGRFNLRDDEVATFRLTKAPGFLTERVPERLTLLPAWMGPIKRLLGTPNPIYNDVLNIELGHTELQIVSFSLDLNPRGDERGRTGVLQVITRPTSAGGAVKLLKFDLNIFGSVSDLLQHSMINQVRFEVR